MAVVGVESQVGPYSVTTFRLCSIVESKKPESGRIMLRLPGQDGSLEKRVRVGALSVASSQMCWILKRIARVGALHLTSSWIWQHICEGDPRG